MAPICSRPLEKAPELLGNILIAPVVYELAATTGADNKPEAPQTLQNDKVFKPVTGSGTANSPLRSLR